MVLGCVKTFSYKYILDMEDSLSYILLASLSPPISPLYSFWQYHTRQSISSSAYKHLALIYSNFIYLGFLMCSI